MTNRLHWIGGACALMACGAWMGSVTSTGNAQVLGGEVADADPVIGPVGTPVPNTIKREPVLVYDLSGTTLVGEYHTNVVVYNDGFTVFSRRDVTVFPEPDVVEDVATGFATQNQVKTLVAQLTELGAAHEIDADFAFFDVPLATVTFFPKAAPRARANTYSFSSIGTSGVEDAIDNFVDLALGM